MIHAIRGDRVFSADMADKHGLSARHSVPSKLSVFERQKAEAEAKKAKEEAETAAVLDDFVKSFEGDGNALSAPGGPRVGAPPAAGRRHFTSSSLKSGPGSLGPTPPSKSGPGSLGLGNHRKRPYDEYSARPKDGRFFSYHDETRDVNDEQDAEEDKAAAKPTIHLASLPVGTSVSAIKGLFVDTPLAIDNVRVLPSTNPSGNAGERKSMSAIVTLAAETPATDIDTVVSRLQNKYLGLGYKLSISRHLSSAALGSNIVTSSVSQNLPFGAKPIQQNTSLSRAPPPSQRFAPPSSYTNTPYQRGSSTQVTVQTPSDIAQLRLIHKVLEAQLEYGPEFEAALQSRLAIQRDERWAWLWDTKSVGGIYYRWRLWEILTNSPARHGLQHNETVFDGQSSWLAPDQSLAFEWTVDFDELVSGDDYNSSDEEEDEEDRGDLSRRHNDHHGGPPAPVDETGNSGTGCLNPISRARLIHLLSELPESNTKIRRGDIGSITNFAIGHASAGPDEIAAIITSNVIKPFAKIEDDDTSSASMVGLYVVSDILSCSASAGVRHAWRYRTMFEHAFKKQRVFEKLGRAEKDFKWGKLKAEKWKRSVQSLLSMWENWSVFPQSTQEAFVDSFLNPPPTIDEQHRAEFEAKETASAETKNKTVNKWKTVDDVTPDKETAKVQGTGSTDKRHDRVTDQTMEDDEVEDVDGESMVDSSDEEADGSAIEEQSNHIEAVPEMAPSRSKSDAEPVAVPIPTGGKRQRPRAVDMFADESD